MLEQMKAITEVFEKGKMVANPAAWKNGQVAVNLVAVIGALIVILDGFGYHVNIDQESINTLVSAIVGLYGIYNSVATVVTTDKIGITKTEDKG